MTSATETRIRTATDSGPAILTEPEIRCLLALPDRRTRLGKRTACLLALLCAGPRVGEVVRLRREQVEIRPGGMVRIDLKQNKRPAGAPEKHRIVGLSEQESRLVREWLAYSDSPLWLLPGRRGEHLSVRAAQVVVTAALAAVGRSDLHVHSLRHSAAVMLVRQTGDLYLVSRALGHSSIRVTESAYVRWDVRDADRVAAAATQALAPRAYRKEAGH